MTKKNIPSPDRASDRSLGSPLQVTAYDRTAGLLIASLMLASVAALTLFVVWLTSVMVLVRISTPVAFSPGTPNDPGFARDPDSPGLEELSLEMERPQVEAALEPISQLASTIAASDSLLVTDAIFSTRGERGKGDLRIRGDRVDEERPQWVRWQIRYQSHDLDEYARQLDYFGIELAAAGGNRNLDYAFHVSRSTPSTRQGAARDERRMYLTWEPGSRLRGFDEQLLTRAGIKTEGRIIMQFLPESLCQDLRQLEFDNAGGRPQTEWLKTYFIIKKDKDGYKFHIEKQVFGSHPHEGSPEVLPDLFVKSPQRSADPFLMSWVDR